MAKTRPQKDTGKATTGALRVLHVEDNPADAELILRHLRKEYSQLSPDVVATPEEFLERLRSDHYDLVLADYNLPNWSGMEALAVLRAQGSDIPFILVTGTMGDERAVECVKAGVTDYVIKENLSRLPLAVRRALDEKALREEQRRAEEALRASEHRYRRLFESAKDGILILDAEDGQIIDVNPFMVEFLGYSRQEFFGKQLWEIGLLKDREASRNYFRTLQETGYVRYEDLPLESKSGRRAEVEFVSNVYESDARKVIQCNIRDITERKGAEEEIRIAKDEWELTFDAVPDPVLVMNGECRIARANRAAAALVGLEPAQMIGRHCYEVLHGTTEPRPDCPHQQLIQTGSEARGDIYEIWLDKYFATTATPLRDRAGALRGCVHVLRDVTDHKRAEEALRTSEERFEVFMNNNPAMAWMKDEEGRYVYFNRTFERLLEVTQSGLVGKTDLEICPAEIAQQFRENDLAVLSSGKPQEFTEPMPDPTGGREAWVLKFPFADSTGRRLVGGMAIEITERKRLEAQLLQAQKMEAVGQLAGGIAHDFNNLLTVIIGYSQLLLDRLRSDDPMRPNVSEIKNAGEMAAQLTRQLLAFSRRQALAPQVLDINAVIANVEKMIRRMIGDDIVLDFVPGPGVGRVKADPWQIEQVLLNLAVNARDAMPKGGKLTFEVADIELDEAFIQSHIGSTPGPFVVLTVSDSGCGMDEATQAHIFEPFFTTKEKGKGTGLGLAMAYGIVKQSGGYITVQSEPGKGATFKIYLPRIDQPVEVAEPRKARVEPARGSETVLLVEDEPGLRELARSILEMSGYTVLEASSGNEALLKGKTHKGPIHLMVTDVVMPEMNGRELAKRLASLYSKMKVLYMSGYAGDAIVKRGAIEPGVAFLQKPFEPDTLARKVREVLDQ